MVPPIDREADGSWVRRRTAFVALHSPRSGPQHAHRPRRVDPCLGDRLCRPRSLAGQDRRGWAISRPGAAACRGVVYPTPMRPRVRSTSTATSTSTRQRPAQLLTPRLVVHPVRTSLVPRSPRGPFDEARVVNEGWIVLEPSIALAGGLRPPCDSSPASPIWHARRPAPSTRGARRACFGAVGSASRVGPSASRRRIGRFDAVNAVVLRPSSVLQRSQRRLRDASRVDPAP